MQKAIFSRIDLVENADNIHAKTYLEYTQDLLSCKDVQELKNWSQHLHTSRFQHSLNVSYYSFLIAKKFGLDACSIARAGLLHDLYFYDWREKETRPKDERHCSLHPQLALENAEKNCKVNAIMKDAILHHMWPMTIHMPKTKEGWILQAVDKYCALSEILLQSSRKLRYSRSVLSCLAIFSFLSF